MTNNLGPADKFAGKLLFTGLLMLLIISCAEAGVLMLVLGGVYSETGWGQPVSYAGALTLTWLVYTLKMVWGFRVKVDKESA